MKITYNWLKEFVEFDLPPSDLSNLLTMAGLETTPLLSPPSEGGERGGALKGGVDGDHVIEIDLTPNRSDCHSVIGIAREVSALTGGRFKYPDVSIKESDGIVNDFISVAVEDPKLCPRYTARIIRDVKIGTSPAWLENKLKAVGLRPINNIVDITNYILWETGQPLHAFDYTCIKGKNIIVRKAYKDETFISLDEKEYRLSEDSLVIADTERALALAGIIGGKDSAVKPSTRYILLESAYFNPVSIRRTSRRLGIFTDSSYRFERGVDPDAVVTSLDIAANLIGELSGGKVIKDRIDSYPEKILSPQIDLRISYTNKILGTSLNRDYISNLLSRLMFSTKIMEEDKINVYVPSFRRDVKREVDLIEEVARVHGYENISKTIPSTKISLASPTEGQISERKIRNILTSMGLMEIISYSFMDERLLGIMNIPDKDSLRIAVKLRNPLSQNSSLMRTTLLTGIIQAVIFNIHRGVYDVGIFEIGKVFISSPSLKKGGKGEGLPVEKTKIGGAITSRIEKKIRGKGERDFYSLKGIVESLLDRLNVFHREFSPADLPFIHPQKGAYIKINNESEPIGFLGELHTEVSERFDLKDRLYVFELDLNTMLTKITPEIKYKPLPRYPAIYRDIAVILDSQIRSVDIEKVIRETDQSILKEIILFDYYEGKQIPAGKKSLAYSLVYRSDERTLTDEDVNPIHEKIITALKENLGAVLR
jgi:phenylalanyl-tRNA synthetase beta chain